MWAPVKQKWGEGVRIMISPSVDVLHVLILTSNTQHVDKVRGGLWDGKHLNKQLSFLAMDM